MELCAWFSSESAVPVEIAMTMSIESLHSAPRRRLIRGPHHGVCYCFDARCQSQLGRCDSNLVCFHVWSYRVVAPTGPLVRCPTQLIHASRCSPDCQSAILQTILLYLHPCHQRMLTSTLLAQRSRSPAHSPACPRRSAASHHQPRRQGGQVVHVSRHTRARIGTGQREDGRRAEQQTAAAEARVADGMCGQGEADVDDRQEASMARARRGAGEQG